MPRKRPVADNHRMALPHLAVAGLAAAALTASACSGAVPDSTGEADPTAGGPPAAVAPAVVAGAGCAAYAQAVPAGPGSLDGMAADPVAVAVSNSPLLTTLAGALAGRLNADVDLTDTLDKGEYTVFAPTDDAFGRLDPATIEKLKADPGLLKSVLSYHVVPGQPDAATLVAEHRTLQGAPLTVTGSDEDLRVNGAAVVCGGIKTANATVYLIDTVLMPPLPAPPGTANPSSTAAATPAG